MSYNRNYNNNFHGSNFTFRYVPDFPPPPLPPPVLHPMRPQFFFPPPRQQLITTESIEKRDQDFIKRFESLIPEAPKKYKPKTTTITQIKEDIQDIQTQLKDCKIYLDSLNEKIEELPEDEWKKSMDEMDEKVKQLSAKLKIFVESYMNESRKILAKRTAKRLRLKRLKEEWKLAKKERQSKLNERSRKIDENLQKIKDDILKAQKAEEAKLEADVVLKEVRRQKLDAKKSIVKLDAILKLRKARQNTVRGRGETVSEKESTVFINNIEKLKKLWNQKLQIYENEECVLNEKLAEDAVKTGTALDDTSGVEANLRKWREVLFGDSNATPQFDFRGDIQRFIAVRSQWDQYVNEDGTPLPVGWVVPNLEP